MADDVVYAINEKLLPLDRPGTWKDQTIHVLRPPAMEGATASLSQAKLERDVLALQLRSRLDMRVLRGSLMSSAPA